MSKRVLFVSLFVLATSFVDGIKAGASEPLYKMMLGQDNYAARKKQASVLAAEFNCEVVQPQSMSSPDGLYAVYVIGDESNVEAFADTLKAPFFREDKGTSTGGKVIGSPGANVDCSKSVSTIEKSKTKTKEDKPAKIKYRQPKLSRSVKTFGLPNEIITTTE